MFGIYCIYEFCINRERPPAAWFNKSLEDCVFASDPECQVKNNFQKISTIYETGYSRYFLFQLIKA
jgi:hypothetical protein